MSFVVSYAQNREDFLISAFFPDIKEGFYVDVGANHPLHDSVTKLFYSKGWNGINIEPVKSQYELLVKKRPRDINLNLGISDKAGELSLRLYNGSGLSTFANSMKEAYQTTESNPNAATYEDVQVPVKPLKQVFREEKVDHVHFLKIDVEGFEYKVLQGMDWDHHRPELICIESNHIDEDWRPYLLKHGYFQVFFDGLNGYYLAEESRERAQYFDYPQKMLAGPQIIKWSVKDEFDSQMKPIEHENVVLRQREKELVAERDKLYLEVEDLKQYIQQQKSLRQATKNVGHELKRKLRDRP